MTERPDKAMVAAYLASKPPYTRLGTRFETYHLYWVLGLSAAALGTKAGITTRAAEKRVRRLRQAARRWGGR